MRLGKRWDEDDVVPPEAQKEAANSGLSGKGFKVHLQWGQIAELWELCQKLSYLEGCHTHIPWGQVIGMCGAAKDMAHHMVGVTVEAGGVIGPAYGEAVGLEPRAVARTELGQGASVRPGQQVYGWVNWRGSGQEHFVGCLRPDDLLYHPASYKASGYGVSSLLQHAFKDEGRGVGGRAGQYLNTLYLNTVFKYIYCIYTLYLNTFFNLYLISVFKYFSKYFLSYSIKYK